MDMNPIPMRPRMNMCRYCGREYGKSSLLIHEKACSKTNDPPRPGSLAQSRKPQSSSSNQRLAANAEPKSSVPDHQSRNTPVSKIIQNAGKIIQSSNLGSSNLQSNKKIPAYQAKPIQSSSNYEPQSKTSKTGTMRKPASKMNIPEYATGADDRVECRKCKRKFNPDRIQKHTSVCIGPINEFVEKPIPRVQKKRKVGVPLWKKQHLDFINNVRYAKKMTMVEKAGGDIRKIQAPVQHYDPASDYKQCPYCSRKFNQEVAQRHIPNCKNIINKPKPPPKAAPKSYQQAGGNNGYGGSKGYGDVREVREVREVRDTRDTRDTRDKKDNRAGGVGGNNDFGPGFGYSGNQGSLRGNSVGYGANSAANMAYPGNRAGGGNIGNYAGGMSGNLNYGGGYNNNPSRVPQTKSGSIQGQCGRCGSKINPNTRKCGYCR